jgi:hypothetical protein
MKVRDWLRKCNFPNLPGEWESVHKGHEEEEEKEYASAGLHLVCEEME